MMQLSVSKPPELTQELAVLLEHPGNLDGQATYIGHTQLPVDHPTHHLLQLAALA
jgi:hypothetical protein